MMRKAVFLVALLFLPIFHSESSPYPRCVRKLNIGVHDEVTLAKGNGILSVFADARVDQEWMAEVLRLNGISLSEAKDPDSGLTICFRRRWQKSEPPPEIREESAIILEELLRNASAGDDESYPSSTRELEGQDLASEVGAIKKEIGEIKEKLARLSPRGISNESKIEPAYQKTSDKNWFDKALEATANIFSWIWGAIKATWRIITKLAPWFLLIVIAVVIVAGLIVGLIFWKRFQETRQGLQATRASLSHIINHRAKGPNKKTIRRWLRLKWLLFKRRVRRMKRARW